MQSYQQQSAPLTTTMVLACTALALAVSLALITASLVMLTHLELSKITIPATF